MDKIQKRREQENQSTRLREVLSALKKHGISQKAISVDCKISEDKLSRLKTGEKIKNIPDSFLEELQKNYHINPKYIRLESEHLWDIFDEKLDCFEKFVDSWETVAKEKNDYLQISMDPNFYKFLLGVDKAKLFAENDNVLAAEIERLANLYTPSSKSADYVVIPVEPFIDIIRTTKDEKKHLSELLDFLNYEDFIEDDKEDSAKN